MKDDKFFGEEAKALRKQVIEKEAAKLRTELAEEWLKRRSKIILGGICVVAGGLIGFTIAILCSL